MNDKPKNESKIDNNKYLSRELVNISENSNKININKNNDDLLIKKNRSNNCNIKNRNLYIKKLVFNPISEEYKKKIKNSLLTPIPRGSLTKNQSTINLDVKQRLPPLNLKVNRPLFSKNKNENSMFKNKSQNLENFSTNILSDNKRKYNKNSIKSKYLNIKIIDFLTKYKTRKHEEKKIKNIYNNIYNDKRIQEFKKSILDLYNKINESQRKYLNNANFIHRFLFDTDRNNYPYHESFSAPNKNSSEIISYDYNIKEINPKFEYIDYFGKESKVVTRLTSNVSEINPEGNKNEGIKNIKLNRQLKAPKLIALKDSEDFRNKNYIKILEKKKKKEKIEEAKRIKQNKKMDNVIEISKKGFELLQNDKKKSFSGLIKHTIKEHKSVIKQLNDMIEIDKEHYEKNFDEININLNEI